MSEIDALIKTIKERAVRQDKSVNYDVSFDRHLTREAFTYPARISPTVLFAVPVEEVIQHYYHLVLRRPADAQGVALYQPLLEAGMPALMVLFDLSRSPEGRSRDIPIEGLGLARILYYGTKLAKKLGCHRPMWALLHRLVHHYQHSVQRGLSVAKGNHQTSQAEMEELAYTVHQLLRRQHELDEGLREARQELAKSRQELQSAYANIQVKQHQQILQVDASSVTSPAVFTMDLQAAIDTYYLAFEDAHRGPSDVIQAGLNDYEVIVQQLPAVDAPALDLGCGRGEWLRWLQERGIRAHGVDGNPVMVAHCIERGLSVTHADLLSYLQSLPAQSQRLVTSFHVIEHLPFDVLFVMLREIHRVLVPGAWMILETPNPENVLVGSHTFYHDFSHKAPITPTSIEFLAQYQGFVSTRILRRNPYPESARVIGSDPLTERLNGHLCGPQDFALIAQTPLVS